MIDLSSYVQSLDGKPVAVFGLARSGLSTVKALKGAGADIIAWDDKQEARKKAEALGAKIQQLDQENLKPCAALILAPGVPLHFPEPHDVVKAARAAGIEIICDVEILYRCRQGRKMIGITGTNGKSTTTTLLKHTLKSCGVSVACGGNIGVPVFDLDMPSEDGVFLLELSSYQLDLCPTLALDIAVLLNISPDHLDRHGSMENYISAKMRIFKDAQVSICGVDDLPSRKICEGFEAIPISMNDEFGIVDNTNLRGDHNRQNMAAAFVVAKQMGCAQSQTLSAFESFPGLAHRQFLVHKIGEVMYVNDSKATNVESSAKALASFEDIYWIIGGQLHNDDLNELNKYLGWVRHAFVIGEASEKVSKWLEAQNVGYKMCETLDIATKAAHEMAHEAGQGVVLLSPVYKSWDQYESFEHRGDEFVKLVGAL